ncbi:MAG: TetR/AcrR family transcriptional regulator [Bacteroidetes bacterium]|nr:TetR/AcrR family transcriptional regulator [Bacteroidota bacterium]
MVKKRKDDTTEGKILAAARKVFTTKGMAGARMQDIADEAGINKAMLHYYFKDKEKLFEVVFMEGAGEFFPRINKLFESDASLEEMITRFVEEYLDAMQRSPYLPWFIMNELNRDADTFLEKIWAAPNRPNPAKFLALIEKEIKKGNIKRISPLHLLLNLLSMTIFPFIAKPMITRNLHLDEMQFRYVIEQRKTEIPKFIMDSIRK